MKKMFRLSMLITIVALVSCGKKTSQSWKVFSPDSTVCMELSLCPSGMLHYNVTLDGDTMIQESPLGLIRADGDFSSDLSFVSTEQKTIDETYKMITGKRSKCTIHAVEQIFNLSNSNSKPMQVVVRVSDNGTAFKYVFPEVDTANYTVTSEKTGFAIPAGKAWMHPYDKASDWSPAYETNYQNEISIGTPAPGKEGWAFPMLFSINEKWMLISEANTPDDYFSAHVQLDEQGRYMIAMPDSAEGRGIGAVEPVSSLPWETSWRVMIIGKSLANIFESTLITDVCDATVEGDFSWVKPGRAAWSWWSAPNSPKQAKAQMEFIDFAKEIGWEYVLVDANWDTMEQGNIAEVIAYAKTKEIGIILWYNSGGPNNVVTERPRNLMYDATIRDAEFKKLQEWGVVGVKVDFFQSDKAACMKHYHDILKDAAKYKVMVNFHGCTLPKGWQKTYPHLMSMEAVKGSECYIFDKTYPENVLTFNSIYPFTRNVIGSMDYTPVALSNSTYPHLTSNGHELAQSVVFESGIIHFADKIASYRALPAKVKEILTALPAAWDDSRLIDGYPGKFAVVARKKDADWYVGGLNSDSVSRKMEIKLDILGAGNYQATVIQDDAMAKTLKVSESKVTAEDVISVEMQSRGGFVIKIKR